MTPNASVAMSVLSKAATTTILWSACNAPARGATLKVKAVCTFPARPKVGSRLPAAAWATPAESSDTRRMNTRMGTSRSPPLKNGGRPERLPLLEAASASSRGLRAGFFHFLDELRHHLEEVVHEALVG